MSDDISIIENAYKKTISNEISWKLESSSSVPKILYELTDIHIISCYSFTNTNGTLYLFKYRYRAYDGEHDSFYSTENVTLALVKEDQIVWSNNQNYHLLYDLYDVVSNTYSGILNFF